MTEPAPPRWDPALQPAVVAPLVLPYVRASRLRRTMPRSCIAAEVADALSREFHISDKRHGFTLSSLAQCSGFGHNSLW